MNSFKKYYRWILVSILLVLILTGCTQETSSEEELVYFPECTAQELIQAIVNANSANGPVEIQLPANCVYTLDQVDNSFSYLGKTMSNGLPEIENDITIEGNDAVIKIDYLVNGIPFGHFFLNSDFTLELRDLTLETGVRPLGGSVFVSDGELVLYNVSLLNNRAIPKVSDDIAKGGAIYNHGGKLRIMANTTFRQNLAGETMGESSHFGGAIYSIYGDVAIYNSHFYQNFAAGDGGAIYSTKSPSYTAGGLLLINNSEFIDNSAMMSGGALALFNEDEGVFIASTSFMDNESDLYGGAIYSRDSDLNINFSTFNSNNARDGGAIYTFRTAAGEVSSLIFDNSELLYNVAFQSAGGLFSANSDLLVEDSRIRGNQAARCGGLQLGGPPGLDVAGGELPNITYVDSFSEILSSSVYDNQALNDFGGGACHFMGELAIHDTGFTNNETPSYGGAIISLDELEITSSHIARNNAYRGAGLAIGFPLDDTNYVSPAYLDFQSSVDQTELILNNAADAGGGIWSHHNGSLWITKSVIGNNSAVAEGGGVFMEEGVVAIDNSTLAQNTAFRGGGLYAVGDNSVLRLQHATIAYNTATDAGSGLRAGGGGLNINGSVYMNEPLVVRNTNNDCDLNQGLSGDYGVECDGYCVQSRFGVDSDGSCNFQGHGTESNPGVATFNGSYVQILPNSPLIAASHQCYEIDDQIGTARPEGASCEPGAIEYYNIMPPPPPPSASDPEEEEPHPQPCDPFAGLDISVHMLNVDSNSLSFPVYLRFPSQVPELGDGTMPYQATLGGLESSLCNQQGFEDRLYCIFTLQPDYPGTLRELNFYKDDCSDPVFTQPDLSIPEIPSGDLTCRKDLGEKNCAEAGGTWLSGRDDPYCLCP